MNLCGKSLFKPRQPRMSIISLIKLLEDLEIELMAAYSVPFYFLKQREGGSRILRLV